jgi:hypothetical protein
MDKVTDRLPVWMAKLLTRTGRLVLTKVTLTSLFIYPGVAQELSPWANGQTSHRQNPSRLPLVRYCSGLGGTLSCGLDNGLPPRKIWRFGHHRSSLHGACSSDAMDLAQQNRAGKVGIPAAYSVQKHL